MSQLVFSLHQNPKDVGSEASEGLDWLAGKREQASSVHILYIGCQKKAWPRSKLDLQIDLFPIVWGTSRLISRGVVPVCNYTKHFTHLLLNKYKQLLKKHCLQYFTNAPDTWFTFNFIFNSIFYRWYASFHSILWFYTLLKLSSNLETSIALSHFKHRLFPGPPDLITQHLLYHCPSIKSSFLLRHALLPVIIVTLQGKWPAFLNSNARIS